MKILMITPYVGSVYGGTSKVFTDLIQGLSDLDVAVDIVTTNANGSGKLEVSLQRWIKQKNYRIQYFPCYHNYDFVISASLINWLLNNIQQYDLVHTNTLFSVLMSLVHWICDRRKIPYVMTPHGMLDPWALSYKAWKKRIYYHWFEKPSLQRASAIHVLNRLEAHHVNALGFEQAVVIPNGVHRQEFEALAAPDEFYHRFPATQGKILILFLGRIDPKKGLDLLAPAFAQVHAQFPQTHLVVAGPDSIGFLPIVQGYFAQAGCLEATTFTGMLEGTLKQAAIAAASVYVAPSYSEGFSMSILEGMASGLPCVLTTGCNFPEAAEVAHIANLTPDAIAQALIQCLHDPAQAQAMGNRARQFVFEHYTWNRAAAKLVQVYEAILNGKSLPEVCN